MKNEKWKNISPTEPAGTPAGFFVPPTSHERASSILLIYIPADLHPGDLVEIRFERAVKVLVNRHSKVVDFFRFGVQGDL